MILNHDRITIRNAEATDATCLEAWWNDGRIMAHAGFPNGLGTTVDRIIEKLRSDSDQTGRRLMLLFDSIPIGELCYRNMGAGVADIGIKICDFSHQDRGIGRVALSMLIKYLFDNGYTKIVLDTNLKNSRAQHVYEKLGFRKLRVNINSWYNQLGNPESSVDYELIPDDFHNYAV